MNRPTVSPRLRTYIVVVLFWTFLGSSYAITAGSSSISQGHPPNWTRAFAWNLLEAYLWMLLVPGVARLGRYTAGRAWQRFVAFHLMVSAGVAVTETLVMLTIFWWWFGPGLQGATTLGEYWKIEMAYSVHPSLLMYWTILLFTRSQDTREALRRERVRAERLEAQLVQAQLGALRMQLRPHFLFNTLNSISALVLADPAKARLMISRLSEFLRMTLDDTDAHLVPLATELRFVQCYLEIQTVRFPDRLGTRTWVDEAAADAMVPYLILQPLVENALKHGLLCRPGPGCLTIAVARDADQLVLEVTDDGIGFVAGSPDGVGLGNTRERLRVLFADQASLAVGPVAGGGTAAVVRLPYRERAHG